MVQRTMQPPVDSPSMEKMIRLADLLRGHPSNVEVVTAGGGRASLSQELADFLQVVAAAVSQGHTVTVAADDDLLSTQEAADLLKISLPTLRRLLDAEEIGYEVRGKRRRVRREDVLEYQQRNRKKRRGLLDEMSRDAHAAEVDQSVDKFFPTR